MTKEEASKFKIGQKVRICLREHAYYGQIVTIKEIDYYGRSIIIRTSDPEHLLNTLNWRFSSSLKPINDFEISIF